MRKKYLILFLLFVLLQTGFSQSVDIETAKTVAINFLSSKQSPTSNKINNVLTETYNSETVFYVVNFTNGGWVLISASNSTWPILGYGTKGEFKLDNNKPSQLIDLLDNYKAQIKASSQLKSADIQVSEKWGSLEKGNSLKSLIVYTPGTNLLNVPGRGEVIWGQDYNNDGGCTPSYHKYCPSGTGDLCF